MSSYTLPWTAVRGCQWASPQRRRTPRLPAEGDPEPEQMCRPIGRLRPIGVSIPFSCFNMFQFRLADRRATLGRKQARCISRHIDTDETDQSVHFNLTVQSRLYPDTFDHVWSRLITFVSWNVFTAAVSKPVLHVGTPQATSTPSLGDWFTVVHSGCVLRKKRTPDAALQNQTGSNSMRGRWGSDGTTWCFGQDVQLACCTTQIWTFHSISFHFIDFHSLLFIVIHCHSMSPVSMLSICNHSPGLRCLECLDSGILSRMSQGCLDSEWLRMTQTHWSWEVHLKPWMCQIYPDLCFEPGGKIWCFQWWSLSQSFPRPQSAIDSRLPRAWSETAHYVLSIKWISCLIL